MDAMPVAVTNRPNAADEPAEAPAATAAAAAPATVYLVGAGPGDPDLLTRGGANALARAAVVIYDYLANADLLALCPPTVEKIYVGKSGVSHTMTQDDINALLVAKAREVGANATAGSNLCVVRLKGGDPYVFGRGGEEAQYLIEHHVPFVEIPGITAGIAGPAYAGIPVTHRDFTSTVTFVTGHERAGPVRSGADAAPRVDYETLARLGGTLVFYMGVKFLPNITSQLMRHGLGAQTPAAIVQWATTARQRTVFGTLENIADAAVQRGITAPAITIIGRVAGLAGSLDWFSRRPLFGRTILVTRSRQQASNLAAGLAALGARVLETPTIAVEKVPASPAINAVVSSLARYACVVFTSANGVEAFYQHLRATGRDARALQTRIAAVGPATAAALEKIGVVPEIIPEVFVAEALAEKIKELFTLSPDAAPNKFLLVQGDIARPVLRDQLKAAGAVVEELILYHTTAPEALPAAALAAIEQDVVDAITFTSASTADNFYALLPAELRPKLAQTKRISIGPLTTQALVVLGLPPAAEANPHTIAGVIAACQAALPPPTSPGLPVAEMGVFNAPETGQPSRGATASPAAYDNGGIL